MAWDTNNIETALTRALNRFNWSAAEKICQDLIAETYQSDEPYPEKSAKKLLSALRQKQCLNLMATLAEAFIRSGADSLQIQRQYAQSLIDRGNLTAAEAVLNSIIVNSQNNPDPKIKTENIEARGLLGRTYKQLYVDSDAPESADAHRNLQKALEAYYGVYRSDNGQIWHGINAVAVIRRAERDGVSLKDAPDADVIAAQIINFLEEKEKKEIADREELSESELQSRSEDPLPPWDIATKIEALIATGQYEAAEESAFRYTEHEWADAFEINSTLRQLKQVWKLADENSPGSNVISLLQAAYLQRRGASASISPHEIEQEQIKNQQSNDELEAKFGNSKTRPLQWVNNMLERCKSIARIEKLDGSGHGTGWLVDGGDFFTGMEGRLMVLTNYHVVSPKPFPRAIMPNQAQVHFEVNREIFGIESIYWSSPVKEYDATFLLIDGQPTASPLPLFKDVVKYGTPPPSSLFVIGHPGGGNIAFSLEDNLLIAANEKVLHYRAPTEKGSSGSPVFDDVGWQVVALHHSGSSTLRRLDDPMQTYEANEGISIVALQQQTRLVLPH